MRRPGVCGLGMAVVRAAEMEPVLVEFGSRDAWALEIGSEIEKETAWDLVG